MCEQTEINYLDGDIVWVKLGACWWPGEVTSFQNLPEDIQGEFRKKPLIAAVKFFQEDTYEFVKNLHQIYKYNCTQKDEFIKKGLDKYRTKSKDGSSYMDKFPGDVEMAEKLTGGNPDILTSQKFSPEEKPDISALFGEKKIPKRKRDGTDMRRSEGGVVARKITHPRFIRESDHEIRIRQQPSSLPSTPKTPSSDSPQFSCHLCNFTSSRVNVIICHTKSHRSGSFESPVARPRISTHSPPKSASRLSTGDTQKRKYVKKVKSQTSKSKTERKSEPIKRKYTKQIEKTTPTTKKKKTDPELREKLLADWDDESDEDMDLDLNKTIESSIGSPSTKTFDSSINISTKTDEKMDEEADDGTEIIKASEKLLRDTEKFTSLLADDSPSRASRNSNSKHAEDLDLEDTSTSLTKDEKSLTPKKHKKIIASEDVKQTAVPEKDDKKSRLSCFDFDEEDLPEPTITPVRKIPRIFGEKNTSVKKEILKKFTMSQALKNEKDEEMEKTQQDFSHKKDEEDKKEKNLDDKKGKKLEEKKEKKWDEKKEKKLDEQKERKLEEKKERKLEEKKERKLEEKKEKQLEEKKERKLEEKKEKHMEEKKEKFEKDRSPKRMSVDNELKSSAKGDEEYDEITKAEAPAGNENPEENLKSNTTETVEIVEIFEVEGEKDGHDESDEAILKSAKEELQPEVIPPLEKVNEIIEQPMETEIPAPKDDVIEKKEVISNEKSSEIQPEKDQSSLVKPTENLSEKDEVMSEIATTETEDETVSELAESLQGHSENSDTDMTQGSWDNTLKTKVKSPKEVKEIVEKVAPRRRGRPRKSINVSEASGNGDDSLKIEAMTKQKDSPASRHSERKTSESDSDRSYTGRRRKPNKRYLHSEIYARSPDARASKTDESQSETEEKLQKEPKGRSRRGRKSAAVVESRAETLEQPKDQEFEFSSPSVEPPELQDEASASKASDNEHKDLQDKKFDGTETESESNASSLLDFGKKLDAIASPVNITKFLSGDVESTPKQDEETKEKAIQSNEKINKTPLVSEEMQVPEEPKSVTKFDKLPPKKSQIKKFELSQIDLLEACSVQVAAESAAERSMEFSGDTDMEICTDQPRIEAVVETLPKKEKKTDVPETPVVLENNEATLEISPADNVAEELVKNSTVETVEAELARITSEEVVDQREKIEEIPIPEEKEPEKTEIDEKIVPTSKPEAPPVETVALAKESEQPIQNDMFPVEKATKYVKKVQEEETPLNSFQEAFLKTLHVDKEEDKNKVPNIPAEKPKEPEIFPENVAVEGKPVTAVAVNEELVAQRIPTVPTLNAMTEFEGVEILVQENIEVPTKLDEANASQSDLASSLSGTDAKLEEANMLSLDLQKIEDTLTDAVSTPSPSSDVCVPVKKREKPRIIENVALKEPMQILKSKLLEKLPSKTTKHKLESDTPKRSEPKGAPRAKMMKIDSPSPKKSPTKSHFSVSRKLQALKAEESANLAAEKEQEKGQLQVSQTISHPADGEKFIQQSSQSLADMELDINSMPFVLSEDVLTPESIEQMPVVISSIIPSSTSAPAIVPPSPSSSSTSTSSTPSSVPTSLTLTPTSQLVAPHQVQSVTTETPTTSKKKSGTPTILKSKGKAKPTITSIKTIVPPLTGGVKGIKFQSPQAGKAMPLISQKSTQGKYVIVQTGGQMRYSVQGKPGMSQKVAIPAGKGAGNAQIVQQGGKVVILTSAQSGQTKMLPLNISKTLSSKVQKIVNNKGQIYTPISPQGIMSTKTMIAPKSDASSPTTSKLALGTKIISTQGMIAKGGLLTPISSSQSGLISTLPQGIITKGGLYTPISSAQLAGKTIISGKTIVNKAGRLFSSISSQASGTSKAVLAPISHTMTGKAIMNAQGIVTPKGTILTPITGQQVKALAAKSPAKGAKVHYQAVQQKLQLPMLQKCQKIPMSSGSQTKVSAGVKSPSGSGTIVFQNAIVPGQKVTTPSGKKIVRQVVGVRSPQTAITQTASASPQQILQQKIGKTGSATPTMQRVVVPRGRQTKAQQKIVVQKLQETTATGSSPLLNIQGKPSPSIVGNVVKTPQKSPVAHRGVAKANRNAQQQQQQQQQKHLLNVALSSISASNESTTPALRQSQVQPPPLAPLVSTELPTTEHDGNSKIDKNVDNLAKDNFKTEPPRDLTGESQKIEDKVPAQPQIMALPTESSDGTQTYVLVTIDEQGQIQPLDNNTLMSLEGTTQNSDGTRTLYIDPSSLGEAGALDNIVLQFDNGALPNLQSASNVGESSQTTVSTESFSSSEIIQTSNQDILAAALANTDFQQEIGLPENTVSSVMTAGLTQTSLINQTILQSTIIPPTEPISSPSVLETSLTLNQPIMTPLEVPSSLPIQVEATPPSVVSTIPTSLELPITITNPNISYIASTAGGETHIQIPGNSMPDIGEIMESPASAEIAQEIPASTQYLVIPTLDENMTIQAQAIETGTDSATGSVSYSVSIPESAVIETSQVQTTPSMPIIDDSFAEPAEQNFEAPTSEISATKPTEPTEEAEIAETPKETSSSTSIEAETMEEAEKIVKETKETPELFSAQEAPEQIALPITEAAVDDNVTITEEIPAECSIAKDSSEKMEVDTEPITEEIAISVPAVEDTVSTAMQVEVQSSESLQIEATNSEEVPASSQAAVVEEKSLESSTSEEDKKEIPLQETSNIETPTVDSAVEEAALGTEMVAEPAVEMEVYPGENSETPDVAPSVETSSQAEAAEPAASENVERMEEAIAETSQEEAPSQSYEQFNSSIPSDSIDSPTQSAGKSENSREPSQSIVYDPMEIDENIVTGEPPTQSFDDSKQNEASQSYETSVEVNTNAPTQSFNEIMQCQEEGNSAGNAIDDQSFPTQSYEVGKMENLLENLESDGAVSQEGNIPSQSNDIGIDGIGTSSVSTNNLGLNEDETASSSYMPETPENQERDQDQESAISTSSYEIPPCEELNIASSSVIPDTSASAEHTSIHDNGVPEIPTSSYSLNPDSSSTSHVDTLPTSSYEDQVIVEQNVSTSYEVPISMPGLEENSSQNFVTESTDHRDEPSSYYARHPEVSASYYETTNQDSNSRLDADHPQEEVTPSYYETPQDITSEASQSYFRPTPRYSSQSVSPSYYEAAPESEASQSYYSHEIEATEQSSRNVEASQSFYQETNDEMRLRQQGEATPTYTERYPVDYALANSPIERHDLVESSVPATRPTER